MSWLLLWKTTKMHSYLYIQHVVRESDLSNISNSGKNNNQCWIKHPWLEQVEHPRAKSMSIFRLSDHQQRWWLLRPSPKESSNLQQVQVISSSSSLIIYPFLWIRHGGRGNITPAEGRASRVWDFLFKKFFFFFISPERTSCIYHNHV